MRVSVPVLTAALGAALVSAIDPIIVKDRHFVNSKTGDPFFIRGIDYQPGGADKVKSGKDPLSDPETCARDIYNFQQLGLNAVRIYSIDPFVDHDECMSILAAAGMYLILDVNSPLPNQHIYAEEPWTTYTPAYLEHVFTVMEVFGTYDNTMAFIAGNEIIFQNSSAEVAPAYVKAVVRDMKSYMKNNMERQIPIGYASADVLEYRTSIPAYLACGPEEEAIDWFGVNSYQWCGKASYKGSGYDQLVEHYSNYSLPLFLSEFGCNEVRPRVFTEIGSLFHENMTGVFSGGCLYEYSQEGNDYGIVTIKSDGTAEQMSEFDSLRNQYAAAPAAKIPSNVPQAIKDPKCDGPFPNINGEKKLPKTLGAKFISGGIPQGKWKKGALKGADGLTLETKYTIKKAGGDDISDKKIKVTNGAAQTASGADGSSGKKDEKSAGVLAKGQSNAALYAASTAAVLVASFFAL